MKTKTDTETISQDFVYATGRDVKALSDRLAVLEEVVREILLKGVVKKILLDEDKPDEPPEPEKTIEEGGIVLPEGKCECKDGDSCGACAGTVTTSSGPTVVIPEKTYRERAKELGINSFGKSKEDVLKEIAEKENG